MPPTTPPMKRPAPAGSGPLLLCCRCGWGWACRIPPLLARRLGDDLAQQRLVLQLVEVAALGIAAGGLPARDHAAGGLIELAGGLGVEAEPGEAALHVAALALVEADLIFGGLVRFLLEGRGINAR